MTVCLSTPVIRSFVIRISEHYQNFSVPLQGETCNQCAPGHYGNPEEYGGQCIACDCNRNINTLDPNACDAQTGECTGCLYDTAGFNCELCKDYYYGNALARDCRCKHQRLNDTVLIGIGVSIRIVSDII